MVVRREGDSSTDGDRAKANDFAAFGVDSSTAANGVDLRPASSSTADAVLPSVAPLLPAATLNAELNVSPLVRNSTDPDLDVLPPPAVVVSRVGLARDFQKSSYVFGPPAVCEPPETETEGPLALETPETPAGKEVDGPGELKVLEGKEAGGLEVSMALNELKRCDDPRDGELRSPGCRVGRGETWAAGSSPGPVLDVRGTDGPASVSASPSIVYGTPPSSSPPGPANGGRPALASVSFLSFSASRMADWFRKWRKYRFSTSLRV